MNKCLNCNKETTKDKYCCGKCQHAYQNMKYIERWKVGLENGMRGETSISTVVRSYLFNKFNNKCCQCGWNKVNPETNKVPLEVDHIDGNWRNNVESNLRLLCPNCHSLTSTYKALNKSGRNRSKYKTRY